MNFRFTCGNSIYFYRCRDLRFWTYDSWVENWGSHGIIGTDRPRMPWRSGRNSVLWLANHLRGTAGSMSSLIFRLTDVKRNMPSSLMRARCLPWVSFWLLRVLTQRRLARNWSSAALSRRTCWAFVTEPFPSYPAMHLVYFWSCGVRSWVGVLPIHFFRCSASHACR